jgi:hypothetical protein
VTVNGTGTGYEAQTPAICMMIKNCGDDDYDDSHNIKWLFP